MDEKKLKALKAELAKGLNMGNELFHSPLSEIALIRFFQLPPVKLRRKVIQTFMYPVSVVILNP
ncbi:TPA: hypothetical protein RG719_001317 [Morganella morganii subsp. morganii]|nr:hypothetical protein [Morganella morganii subsp. morganii]HDU8673731.1 hypothetical protein [Morganella morganii subsp. morganii]